MTDGQTGYSGDSADWIGLHVFTHLRVDENCMIDWSVGSGGLGPDLRGGTRLTITPAAVDPLNGRVLSAAAEELRIMEEAGDMTEPAEASKPARSRLPLRKTRPHLAEFTLAATGLGEKWIEWALEELLRDQLMDYVMDLNRRAYFLTDEGVRVARKIVAKVDVGGLTAVLRPTVEERNRKTAIAVKRAYVAGRSIPQIILDRRIRTIAGGVLSHSAARNILTRQGVELWGRGVHAHGTCTRSNRRESELS